MDTLDCTNNRYSYSICIYHSEMTIFFLYLLIHRRLYSPSSRPPWRRTWFIILASIVIFILVIYIMATLGRSSTDVDDPFIQNHQWTMLNANKLKSEHHKLLCCYNVIVNFNFANKNIYLNTQPHTHKT